MCGSLSDITEEARREFFITQAGRDPLLKKQHYAAIVSLKGVEGGLGSCSHIPPASKPRGSEQRVVTAIFQASEQ